MRKLILALCLMLGLTASAQQKALYERAREARNAGGEQLENFKKELATLRNAKTERQLLDVANAYYAINDQKTSEEIQEQIKKKYPHGILMRNSSLTDLYKIKGGAEAEKFYKQWLKKFPAKKLGDDIAYDYAAYSVASSYADEGNAAKALEYLHQCKDSAWKVTAYNVVGGTLARKGLYDDAEQVLKEGSEAADLVYAKIQGMFRSELESCYESYANVLVHNGKQDEALRQYAKIPAGKRGLGYAQVAAKAGRNMEAWTICDNLLRDGNQNKDSEELMKTVWQQANGNLDGFDAYVKGIKDKRMADKIAEVKKGMVKEPAPDFTLKDIDGNTVQLSKFRGKVVVIDFWATWCGPCKRSLPAMKMTVDKYKNDSDVAFLFIHTWERGTAEAANKDAKACLQDNGFGEFHLVMDTKDPETHVNKAVSAFGVKGIPAKFVIDKEGNIRFKLTGFSGSNEEAVAELSQMIEMAKAAK